MTEEKQEKFLDVPITPELSKQIDNLINNKVHDIRIDVLRNVAKYKKMYADVLKNMKGVPKGTKPKVKSFNRALEQKKGGKRESKGNK